MQAKSKQPKVIRVSRETSRQLRLTARLAGCPWEEVAATAIRWFAQLTPTDQTLILAHFWREADQGAAEEEVTDGLWKRTCRAALAAVGRVLPGRW